MGSARPGLAAVRLTGDSDAAAESTGAQPLRAIKGAFQMLGVDRITSEELAEQRTAEGEARGSYPRRSAHARVRRPNDWGDTNVADDDKRWHDMNPDEQALVIRQISGAVNGLQFRVQDLEDAVKALQERLEKAVELKP